MQHPKWQQRRAKLPLLSQYEGLPGMNVNDSSNTSRTDWAALEVMTDEGIDYSDIPPLTDEFFEKAMLRVPAAQADIRLSA